MHRFDEFQLKLSLLQFYSCRFFVFFHYSQKCYWRKSKFFQLEENLLKAKKRKIFLLFSIVCKTFFPYSTMNISPGCIRHQPAASYSNAFFCLQSRARMDYTEPSAVKKNILIVIYFNERNLIAEALQLSLDWLQSTTQSKKYLTYSYSILEFSAYVSLFLFYTYFVRC